MFVVLTRVGNSAGLRVPSRVLASLGLRVGDRLFLGVEKDRLVLSRHVAHPKVAALMEALRPMLGRDIATLHLFGSFATPKFKADRSDIDVYIVVRHRRAMRRIEKAVLGLNLRGPPPIQAVVAEPGEVDWGWFECEVHRPGVPLYIDPGRFPDGLEPVFAAWDPWDWLRNRGTPVALRAGRGTPVGAPRPALRAGRS